MKTIIICLMGILSPCIVAQEDTLINLGRLKETVVAASSVNGARNNDNPFYGVTNCFDKGSNVINRINYSYWLSGGAGGAHGQHWISVLFPTSIKVSEIWIITPGLSEPPPLVLSEKSPKTTETHQSRRPWECAIDIIYGQGDAAVTKRLPSFWIVGFRHKVKLDFKLDGITSLKFVFPGRHSIQIEEIEILGPKLAGITGVDEGPRIEGSKPK